MAADRPLTERRVVETKMGRSKFPGKPSKIGNRKRVNLSSCALPEDNDSSKAAKNIYLGLSVFNETFGDNEMVAPGPFNGFSMEEVEEAMAEARLQQRKAEIEHKKQGLNVNFWEEFQNELFSIGSCYNTSCTKRTSEVNKTKLCFDGGGVKEKSLVTTTDNSDKKPSSISLSSKSRMKLKMFRRQETHLSPNKSSIRSVQFPTPRVMLYKLSSSPNSSLQNQAAKRLLQKAKKANIAENKNCAEKKFILPSHSLRSSRVIKPNKRFLEGAEGRKGKLLRSAANQQMLLKESKVILKPLENQQTKLDNAIDVELKIDVSNDDAKKKLCRNSESKAVSPVQLSEEKNKKCSQESPKGSSQVSSSGKIILREARLQLDNSNLSLMEGPFSSPNASNLSPNSQLKVNPIQSTIPGTVVCGVCGSVRFYRVVKQAKKFGILCCESCRKFISRIITTFSTDKNSKLQCLKGKGLCNVSPIIASQQHWKMGRCSTLVRCKACWLQLCLKNFKMPFKMKYRLSKLLPLDMRLSLGLNSSPMITKDILNKFVVGDSSIKDFRWLHENGSISNDLKAGKGSSATDSVIASINENNTETNLKKDKSLRKRRKCVRVENKRKVLKRNSKTNVANEKNRQHIDLKGPRVKHVCRSASVVLGQPIATFPSEPSPTKKQVNDDDCRNCDKLGTTNSSTESQDIVEQSNKDIVIAESKQGNPEKKSNANSKQISNSKAPGLLQQNASIKSKKKGNVKTENMISMDFWESYDPDEVCETGFGLIGSESFSIRALCFLCGSSGQEKLIHCASCCEPYHEFCLDGGQTQLEDGTWKYDWICPRCTICATCGRSSGQQLKCIRCDNSYHAECVDRVGGRLLHSPDRPWVCSVCLRCKSCNGVDVSVFVGNLPLCKTCFVLRQKGNFCPLCQQCYEDDDYDSKMMECGQCKCWVHAKCEGLSEEKYQVLSFLPESVEFICRMCCVMPPAPWWLAVEAELKSGYLGVLKTLSKNRKACTMLKWSPRKQCTCRQVNSVARTLDFDEGKTKTIEEDTNRPTEIECDAPEKAQGERKPAQILQRKTSIEVINHPTESLKLTLKIMKGTDGEDLDTNEDDTNYIKDYMKMKKFQSNEEYSMDSNDCQEDSRTSLQTLFKIHGPNASPAENSDKRVLSSPLNPPSDSGIGSTDDEFKASSLTDEENCRTEDTKHLAKITEVKLSSESFLEDKRECFCFLEVDSYNSRSKPFSPSLLSIKKKVTTSEYSSLQQFHQDMQRMIATTQFSELMDVYYQTMKEIFPWFDPKFSRVYSSSQKMPGTISVENSPAKATPMKDHYKEACQVPKEKLIGQPTEYFYNNYTVTDSRMCLMCKTVGDGPPRETGRMIYCGQNEWVHCNCALWSSEVFEEIDGSLQNVHSAISRGRSIRCPECGWKGASIGCCAKNCQETYHFMCARRAGCIFMDDKTVYCAAHLGETAGKLVQNEKEFEIRRPVYVELDKRKMKMAESNHIRFTVGGLQVGNLGHFVLKLSDQPEAIVPAEYQCTRLFWSCFEPWRIVRYHFSVRVLEVEQNEGVDVGVNLTIDHSREPELLDLKLKQLSYFQEHHTLLDINEQLIEEKLQEKRKSNESQAIEEAGKITQDDMMKVIPVKRTKKEKVVRKIFDQLDSKEDENCLSDNQNTADLLPPDIEEAIFKDLPHDILDGISMQDIFMDIRNEPYENGEKESRDEVNEDPSEIVDMSSDTSNDKSKRNDFTADMQTDFWLISNDAKQETIDESFFNLKSLREFRKTKSDVLPNSPAKKSTTLRSSQRSCSLSWNCKLDGPTNKWKRNSKCHVTVNLLETQDRGNMLQELKFTDGLVSVGSLDSVKELKARLDETRRSLQQEEGKENKCLPWHTRLQPRLLQVDGGVDSSSSGSEAGESPQRLIEENLLNPRTIIPPQPSPYSDSPLYSVNTPSYSGETPAYLPQNLSPSFPDSHSKDLSNYVLPSSIDMNLPQIDGMMDSDSSDVDDFSQSFRKIPMKECRAFSKNCIISNFYRLKIEQFDGSVDSENETGDSPKKLQMDDDLELPLGSSTTEEEPVRCSQCCCTYRTRISYQRHLESRCNDYLLSSSDGELSEEEGLKKQVEESIVKTEPPPSPKETCQIETPRSNQPSPVAPRSNQQSPVAPRSNQQSPVAPPPPSSPIVFANKLEVKKPEIVKKRTYTRRLTDTRITPQLANSQITNSQIVNSQIASSQLTSTQLQQIILPQQNGMPPALIVQDMPTPNIMPTAFIESGPTLQYMTPMEPQNAFAKPQLIATPSALVPGTFQIQPAPEPHLLGGLSVLPQGVQGNMSGIIIQQPQAGTIISPPQGPIVMTGDQMMLGSSPMFEVIQDPQTGGMFLASHNQPVYYNMETIVSNTVMQTNQFVSNVMATSSFSQTSTQVFQASKLEQVVNVPSNYIVVGRDTLMTDKIISSNDIICMQAPHSLVSSQPTLQLPSQSIVNSQFIHQTQAFDAEPKLISAQTAPLRMQTYSKPMLSRPVNTNVNNSAGKPQFVASAAAARQVLRTAKIAPTMASDYRNLQIQKKTVAPAADKIQPTYTKSMPMMRPNVTKIAPKTYEKAVIMPKSRPRPEPPKQPRSRALVDYINNFKSDTCDINPEPTPTVTISPKISIQEKAPSVPTNCFVISTSATNPAEISITWSPSLTSKSYNTTPSPLTSPIPKISVSVPKPSPPSFTPPVRPTIIPFSTPPLTSIVKPLVRPSLKSPVTISVAPPIYSSPAASVISPLASTPAMSPVTEPIMTLAPSPRSPSTMSSLAELKISSPPTITFPSPLVKTTPAITSPILSNPKPQQPNKMLKSFPFDHELKLSITTEDSFPTNPIESPKLNSQDEHQAPPVLPLQDNSQSINNNFIPKPVMMHSPKNLPLLSDEKPKMKKKVDSSDQNCIASKLVTIHPRLVQSQDQNLSENGKNGKLPFSKMDEKGPKLIFDVTSDDGFKSSSTSMVELWANICDSVQEMRAVFKIPPLPLSRKGTEILGMQNHGLQHCLEQLRGAERCIRYKCKYFLKEEAQKGDEGTPTKENLSGCARTEKFADRKEHDIFAWLASKHRRLPKLKESAEETLLSNRRANSLPMAMRYRYLRETSRFYVGVYRSKIHGKGLFCLREIDAGEMVIEYAGEVIRSNLTDKREKYYTDKGIGCYMFRIDDHFVVDATMKGNAARFINHSCEPNCYSRVVDIFGKKHIVIFALRRINIMEELTYDYKFPFEDEKISCHCLSKKCRKYLN